MAVFDYAVQSADGAVQRISRARAKGALLRGQIGPDERILVSRRDPPESRELTADELREHFDLLATGVEDPFSRAVGTPVAAAPPPSPEPPPPAAAASVAAERSAPESRSAPSADEGPEEPVGAPPRTSPQASAPEQRASETPSTPAVPPPPEPEAPGSAEPSGANGGGTAHRGGTAAPSLSTPSDAPEPAAPAADDPAPKPPRSEADPRQTPDRPTKREVERPSAARPRPAKPLIVEKLRAPKPSDPAPSSPPAAASAAADRPKAVRQRPLTRAAPSKREASPAKNEPLRPIVEKTTVPPAASSGQPAAAEAGTQWRPPTVRRLRSKNGRSRRRAGVGAVTSLRRLVANSRWAVLAMVVIGGAGAVGGWLLGQERESVLFAQADGVLVRVEPAMDAEPLIQIAAGQPVTAVVAGGRNPPPSGWVRVLAPEEAAGGFAPADGSLAPDPLAETIADLFAVSDTPVLFEADDDAIGDMTAPAGVRVTAVIMGGTEPPPPGWARIIAPLEVSGGFLRLAALSSTPLPERVETRFVVDTADVLAEPLQGTLPLARFRAGERLAVIVSGGEDQPPAGWGRIVEPGSVAGAYVLLSGLDAAAPQVQQGRYYAQRRTQALEADNAAEGLEIVPGLALHVVTAGGDDAPPDGRGRILEPEPLAGRLVALADIGRQPLPEERRVLYASADLVVEDGTPSEALSLGGGASYGPTSAAAAPGDEPVDADEAAEPVPPSEAGDAAPVTITAGTPVELVVAGGVWGPPTGWGVVMTPEAAAGRWVEMASLSQEPLGPVLATLFAVRSVPVLAAPADDAETVLELARGERVSAVVSGGAEPPPPGWARIREPNAIAGGFVALDDTSETPLSEVRADMFAIASTDFYSGPDKSSGLLGAFPRGTALNVIRSGGESSPPHGWMLVAEPDHASGSFVEAAFVSSAEREPLQIRIEELWEVIADADVRAEPDGDEAVLESVAAGEVVYVVGRISQDWLEIRQGGERVGYLPQAAFSPTLDSAADAASDVAGAPDVSAQSWWAESDASVYLTPEENGVQIGALARRDPVTVMARQDEAWLEVEHNGVSGFVLATVLANERPPVIVRARLLEPPSQREVQRAYPRRALSNDIEGRVELRCRIALSGEADCAVLSEAPEGWGFGDAGLELTPRMRFQPELQDGLPVDGGFTTFAFEFTVDD